MSEPTPRPWKMTPRRPGDKSIFIGAPGVPDSYYDLRAEVDCDDCDVDTAIANAKLIVRAVNAHDKLVEALQKIAKLWHSDRSCSLEAQGLTPEECIQEAARELPCRIAIAALDAIKEPPCEAH